MSRSRDMWNAARQLRVEAKIKELAMFTPEGKASTPVAAVLAKQMGIGKTTAWEYIKRIRKGASASATECPHCRRPYDSAAAVGDAAPDPD